MAGREFHAPLLREVDGLQLTHVVTGDAERAAAARAENPDVRVVPTPDELWAVRQPPRPRRHRVADVGARDPGPGRAAPRARGRRRQAAGDDRRGGPGADRAGRGARGDVHRLPEPAVGPRAPHGARRALVGRPRRGDPLRGALRALAPGAQVALARADDQRARRRPADGPAVAPRRRCARPLRPGRVGLRRAQRPDHRRRRRHVPRAAPRLGRHQPPRRHVARGRPRPGDPAPRPRGDLPRRGRRRRPHGVRRLAGRRRRAPRVPGARRRVRAGAAGPGRVGRLLPRRPRGARGGLDAAGRPGGGRGCPRGARRGAGLGPRRRGRRPRPRPRTDDLGSAP